MADFPELVGFFSYSREDDEDSHGALSALRNRIQGGLRGYLGRTAKAFHLWQDKEAIPSGTLWESKIKNAVGQSVFFIPIITPTFVASPYCQKELQSFLEREVELGRDDLVFPILYIDVPALEDSGRRQSDPVLSLIAKRQYVDWREFRFLDSDSPEVRRLLARFCMDIRDALNRSWVSPQERGQEEGAKAQETSNGTWRRGAGAAKDFLREEPEANGAANPKQPRRPAWLLPVAGVVSAATLAAIVWFVITSAARLPIRDSAGALPIEPPVSSPKELSASLSTELPTSLPSSPDTRSTFNQDNSRFQVFVFFTRADRRIDADRIVEALRRAGYRIEVSAQQSTLTEVIAPEALKALGSTLIRTTGDAQANANMMKNLVQDTLQGSSIYVIPYQLRRGDIQVNLF